MELSELKMIWDSQNEEPLYAMNEAALHGVVRRRNEEINSCISRCYMLEITMGVLCGALMLIGAFSLTFGGPAWLAIFSSVKAAVTPWDRLGLLAASGIWFYYSAYMYRARTRQVRREEIFESTLRGEIDRALAQTEFQVAMARNIVWWGLVPVWVATTLWVLIALHLTAKPAWTYVFMGATIIGALVIVVSGKQRAITNRYQPRQRELEALRAKLADPER